MMVNSKYSHANVERLAHDSGLERHDPPSRLALLSPNLIPNHTTGIDEQRAEQLLLSTKSSRLVRAPSILSKRRKLSWKFRAVTAVLPSALKDESTGVLQALLRKGGDDGCFKNQDTKTEQQTQRSTLLLQAIEIENAEDKVEILAATTTKTNLNEALRKAVAFGKDGMTQRLLQYGAKPSKEVLLDAVRKGSEATVSLLLQAPAQVEAKDLVEVLSEAVNNDARHIVAMLAATEAVKQQTELTAVEVACKRGRYECLLNILLCCPNLSLSFLDQLVLPAFESLDFTVDAKFKTIEALLCAGAAGDGCSAALVLSVEQELVTFIELFVQYGTDVNWGRTKAVRLAVQTGNTATVTRLLTNKSLRAEGASEAMKEIPRNLPPADRESMLRLLLDAGARGPPVDDQLVFAVSEGSEAVVQLLRGSGASLDRNNGGALVEAVKRQQTATLRLLLNGPVEAESLASCFPLLARCNKRTRFDMTALLLGAGAHGDHVHKALRDAVCSDNNENSLINLLLENSADPTFDHMQALRHAIARADIALLRKLLNCPAEVSPGQVSELVHEIVKTTNFQSRAGMLQAAIEKGPSPTSVSLALCYELSSRQSDIDAVELLVRRGNADVSYDDGKAIALSACKNNIEFLNIVMTSPHVNADLCRDALKSMLISPSFDDEQKALRASILLDVNRNQQLAYAGLKRYVEFCTQAFTAVKEWPMRTFDFLLGAKPDVNQEEGEVLLLVTAAGSSALLERILRTTPPSRTVLDRALDRSMCCDDAQVRDSLCSMILQSQPSAAGLASALITAARLSNVLICRQLLDAGASLDHQDCQAMKCAVNSTNVDLVTAFLSLQPSAASIAIGFEQAALLSPSDARLQIMRQLFQAGLAQQAVDQYLSTLVQLEPYDMPLIQLVLEHALRGACNGESLMITATQKRLEVLEKIWDKIATDGTSSHCFDACLAAGHVRDDEVAVLRFLLEKGVSTRLVQQAFLEAVDVAQNRAVGLEAVDLLLSHGGDVDSCNGLAICRACEFGRLDLVQRLCQRNPSSLSRARALHFSLLSNPTSVSAEDFCCVIDLLTASTSSTSPEKPTFAQAQAEFQHAAFVFLQKRPRHPAELKRILQAGCLLSRPRGGPDLLHWAMTRSSPKVKTSCLQLLLEYGVSTTYIVPETSETTVMLAVQSGRSVLLPSLIRGGADASLKDNQGRSPLLLAVEKNDNVAIADLLHAKVAPNDGSLHAAVNSLATNTVKLIAEAGHDPCIPSPFGGHDRKTPLMELIYSVRAHPSNYHLIKQVIDTLCGHGLDLRKPYRDKPIVCHCLDNGLNTTEAMLLAGLAKIIDEDCSVYNDGQYRYSPTMFVRKQVSLRLPTEADQLWSLLKDYGAGRDVYYALNGKQPGDAVGMPEDLEKIHRQRLAKEERDREEAAAHNLQLRRLQEAARLREEISQQEHRASLRRSEAEAEQSLRALQEQQAAQMRHERLKGQEQERQALQQAQWHQAERDREYAHAQRNMRLEMEQRQQKQALEQSFRHQLMLEEKQSTDAKVKAQKSLAANQDRYEERRHERMMKELAMASAVGRRSLPANSSVQGLEWANGQRLIEM